LNQVLPAKFLISSTDYRKCPEPIYPEYAFIGRSNVGKSSLINLLSGLRKLAKISGQPGKTQTINHFLMEESWYLADLPGYGFAKVSKKMRAEFDQMIRSYCLNRSNLVNLFVLVDSRHEPQRNDIEFMEWLSENELPFAVVLTKVDKLSSSALSKNKTAYQNEMRKKWEELPPFFVSSADAKIGREDLLDFISHWNRSLSDHFRSGR
jgi:GTP-binding protein